MHYFKLLSKWSKNLPLLWRTKSKTHKKRDFIESLQISIPPCYEFQPKALLLCAAQRSSDHLERASSCLAWTLRRPEECFHLWRKYSVFWRSSVLKFSNSWALTECQLHKQDVMAACPPSVQLVRLRAGRLTRQPGKADCPCPEPGSVPYPHDLAQANLFSICCLL